VVKAVRTFFVLLLLVSCRDKAEPEAAVAPVKVGPQDAVVVRQERIATGPTLSGTLTAKEEATVRAQVAGSVTAVFAREGETVTTGKLLARIDPGALGAAQSSAQQGVVSARATLGTAQKEQARQEDLFRAGIVSRRDVELARQNTANARAQLAQAESMVSQSQEQLGHTTVTAPIDGVISSQAVAEGDVVQPGSALYTIVDLGSLELTASVPSDELGALRVGSPVEFTVTGLPNTTWRGVITRINPTADPTTRQIEVFVEIPNVERRLVAGLFAEGRIESMSRVGLVVPSSAIDRRMTTPYVSVVRNRKVERVQVVLGIQDEKKDRVEIVKGVQIGDVLLVGAAQQLTPGTVVSLDAALTSTEVPAQ
jgi:RND family efflux transporter MFP subunit